MIAPWKNLLQQYGAIFDQKSADLVVDFGHNHSEEAKLCQRGNAIISLPYTLIEVTGNDAKKFLQGQLSCNLETITTDSSLGAYCNIKGRISALFRICQVQALEPSQITYLLRLPSSMATATVTELKKYGAFSKVSIRALTDDLVVLGLVGAKVINAVQIELKCVADHVRATNHPSSASDNLTTRDYNICLQIPGDINHAELYIEHQQALALWPKLTKIATPCSANAWELLEIMAGIPEIYPETKDAILPHYINLPALNAVSFTKGCYRGQEIIARMQYRGKIKRHLYTAKLQGTTQSIGDSIYIPQAAILDSALFDSGIDETMLDPAQMQSVGTIIRLAADTDNSTIALLELSDTATNAKLVTNDGCSVSLNRANQGTTI